MHGQVRWEEFDSKSKLAWLYADCMGMMYTSIPFILVVFVVFSSLGLNKVIGSSGAAFATFFPAFLIVFVFRWNLCVVGSKRKFRYFCRWL